MRSPLALTLLALALPRSPVFAQEAAAPPAASQAASEESQRAEAIAFLEGLLQTIDERMTVGYRGLLISDELLDSGLFRKRLNLWFRRTPRSVRIEFLEPDEGQIVVWQQGWDAMRVNPPGLVPTLSIDPRGERAMATSHRPVTETGIDLAIERYLETLRQTAEDAPVRFQHAGVGPVGSQTLARYDIEHPRVGQSPVTAFTIWVDPATGMPIHFENRAADGSIYERYRYVEFELNPALSDDQFEM